METENGDDETFEDEKPVEETYLKITQLQHILMRPALYIGSVHQRTDIMWIYHPEEDGLVRQEITYVPGLYKIFDEILVNASDNRQRYSSTDVIRVDIDPENNLISVYNNGQGIPVTIHKVVQLYVPTMIFGHFYTSSNYNDDEIKVTGGRNGFGAKLCNIFSETFTIETACSEYKLSFKQTWNSNMTEVSEPIITEFNGDDYTKITFSPDLAKFGMEILDYDTVGLMSRRVFDLAAITKGVTVFLNGRKLVVNGFKHYIDLHLRTTKMEFEERNQPFKVAYEKCNDRWEVACCPSNCGFQQVSFVNSIATTRGGKHLEYVVDIIIKKLIDVIKRRSKKGIRVKPFQVRNHLWVFINCLIENPTFDSQGKETLTLPPRKFGSTCTFSDAFNNRLIKTGIVEATLSWAQLRAIKDITRTGGKKSETIAGIPKLEDANAAGGRYAHRCTLILTEGDSAKSLAISGLGIVGRDYYGVFPLRGKLLNVRGASYRQLLRNAEINSLCKVIGLKYRRKYHTMADIKTLRYGKVMIMTDQDQDGSHIKGLIINFLHANWPELLRLPFLEEFITPIVKATKGNQVLCFYSLPEFAEWKNATENHSSYHIKYYKGLGTSTSAEAKEYFRNIHRHRIAFRYDGIVDDRSIAMAFSRKHISWRKDWLTTHMAEMKRCKALGIPEPYLYRDDTREITYADFVNRELVFFSNADNMRSIPCLVDGFKPGQRKVIFTCLQRDDHREVKVAQLSGSVAERTAYHHGEVSLQMTIVNLSQDFVGSNNINLLEPRGQFGTRLTGGKDCASARYIFTRMSPLTKLIFHPADNPLLKYETDDDQQIEPQWFIPIIPMILVNGAEGIGTGWSTKIFNYNPLDIIQNLRLMLANKEPSPMHPWYKNFNGSIDYVIDGLYVSAGIIVVIKENEIVISELPIGMWTQTYKESVLNSLIKSRAIYEYREYHTDTTVRFLVTMSPSELKTLQEEQNGLYRFFKLTSQMSTKQMHCFDKDNYLRRFSTAVDILKEFYAVRLDFYAKRKQYLVGQLTAEVRSLVDQTRFIKELCNGTLVVGKKRKRDLIEELFDHGYHPNPTREWTQDSQSIEDESEDSSDDDFDDGPSTSAASVLNVSKKSSVSKKKFDHLLGMTMWMLTEERRYKLQRERNLKMKDLDALNAKGIEQMWLEDLENLEKNLNDMESRESSDRITESRIQTRSMSAKENVDKPDDHNILPELNGVKVDFKITEDFVKAKTEAAQNKITDRRVGGGDEGFEAEDFNVVTESPLFSLLDDQDLSEDEPRCWPSRKNAKTGRFQRRKRFRKTGVKGKTLSKRKPVHYKVDDSDDDFEIAPQLETAQESEDESHSDSSTCSEAELKDDQVVEESSTDESSSDSELEYRADRISQKARTSTQKKKIKKKKNK